MKKSIQMKLPICGFDAKNAILCTSCEEKVDSGELAQTDVDASIILAKMGKTDKWRVLHYILVKSLREILFCH